MERTWKKTLAAGIAAVVLVAALVLAGGKLSGNGTVPETPDAAQTTQQQEPDGQQQTRTDAAELPDPNDPAVVGPKQTDDRRVTGGTTGTTGTTGGKDQYQTDPVPEGRPAPVEPDDVTVDTGSSLTCTISISCATILDNMELCAENKRALVPSDGVILPTATVTFSQGESVFDVLQRVCRDNSIHMESTFTPMYNSAYIEGIGNLYEFDVGDQSGWMYKVNGWFPNYGCSRYQVQSGDTICFVYTCDLGADVGDNSMAG